MNPKVDDCVCCHIRLQHSDKDGHCMVGEMLGSPWSIKIINVVGIIPILTTVSTVV